MKRSAFVIAAVAAATLSACATTPAPKPPTPIARPAPPPPPPPTPLDEFAWSAGRGGNSVVGTVAYRPRPNERWGCAAQSVGLTPETSYSRSRMLTLYGSTERALQTVAEVRARSAANAGLDYAQFVRSTTCDAKDSFSFYGLPDGAWFIIVRVRPMNAAGQPSGEGLVALQRIDLKGGVARQISLPQGVAAPPAAPPPAAPARRPAPRAN